MVVAVLFLAVASAGAAPPADHQIVANGRAVSAQGGDTSDVAPLLGELGDARMVRLVGDAPEAADELHGVMARLIAVLSVEAGFDVFVLPVGIFEGVVTEARFTEGGAPATAAELLYRPWRESDSFLAMLSLAVERTEVIGGLCRFHATAKALYTPHLLAFFDDPAADLLSADLRGDMERLWAGRDRLSRATPEARAEALALADRVIARLDEVRPALKAHYGARRVDLERHMLVNMRTFVELEEIRSEESPDMTEIAARETRQNLDWFLNQRFAGRRLIYMDGRGDSDEPLPTDVGVYTIRLEARPTTR